MPKTNFKTIICFAVLAFCIFFSACGTYREEEDEKLVMLIPCTHQSDISSVVKEANSIVKKKIGIGFELQFIDDNSYDQKLNMKVISKSSDCDVMFIGHLSKYTTAVENNALMPLNALIEKNAPELLDIIPNYLIKDITVNNEIYAIPNEQVVFYQYAYFIQKDLAEKYGWTKTIIESPDELEPFLESVKNGEKTIYPYRTNNGVNMWLLNDYEDIAAGVTIPVNGDYKHAIWKMETPEYMHGVKKLREWYLKGYIRQDVMAVDDDTYDFLDNRYAVYSSRWKPGAEAQIYNKNGIYSRIDSIICCSEFMKNMLDTNPVFKNKTVTLHNFIDKIEPKKSEKENYVLYFGRFAQEKGIETLIGAKNKDFICAGSGPIEDKVNSAPNLKNIGFKSGKELEELIRKAKCTVYPSIWYENCPFSIMESIMYQTPVIASNIGGIPELIDDGKTGYLIPPSNSEALEEAIDKLDDATLEYMVKNCAEKEFDTVETYAKKLIEIYNS